GAGCTARPSTGARARNGPRRSGPRRPAAARSARRTGAHSKARRRGDALARWTARVRSRRQTLLIRKRPAAGASAAGQGVECSAFRSLALDAGHGFRLAVALDLCRRLLGLRLPLALSRRVAPALAER